MPLPGEPCLPHSQNFVRDPQLIDYLLDRSTILSRDLVLEIGPGTGTITELLAWRCRHVVAVEKDAHLAAYLRGRFHAWPNISIHAADFLRFPLPSVPHKVFANIPYAITTAIVTRLVAGRAAPLDSYLIVQRDAAARFIGSPRGTLYAALLYPWFAASLVHYFRPSDFHPAPKVESVLLRLHKRGQALVPAMDAQYFRDFVTFAFTAPYPAIRYALRACLGRPLADRMAQAVRLDPTASPSLVPGTLWVLLFEHLKDAGGVRARRVVAGAEQRLRQQQAGLQKVHRTRVLASQGQRHPHVCLR